METEKVINRYSKTFRNELLREKFQNTDAAVHSFETRLKEMYASEAFLMHDVYPSTDTVKIYAVIAMCLELRSYGFSDDEIYQFLKAAFRKVSKIFDGLLSAIDLLPNCFEIAKKWNISDHEKRTKDGSITYGLFDVKPDSIEYRITDCAYIRMFEYYGIRPMCRIFCDTDTRSYEKLTKHVTFIRHSGMWNGNCCHDEVIRKK